MKKITFNAPLNQKAYSYEPMQIEVEKITPSTVSGLSRKRSVPLRYALFQVARIIWMHDPVFKAYYEKKLAEGKHYYVILGHIQKKLCRLVYSLMKSGNNYEVRS